MTNPTNVPGPIVQGSSTRGNSLFAPFQDPFNPPPGANPLPQIILNLLPITNNYELDLEPGSYAVAGADATLLADRQLNLEPGSYSVSGADAGLAKGQTLNAEPGSYSFAGSDATLLANRFLNLEPGSYSVSGIDASLLSGRALNLESGIYTVTGFDATLTKTGGPVAYELDLEPGSYLVLGFDAALESSGGAGQGGGGFYPPSWVVGDAIRRARRKRQMAVAMAILEAESDYQ